MHTKFDPRLEQGWWALRIGLGLGPFLAGLDKFFNLLANWPMYISPPALKVLPFSGVMDIKLIPAAAVLASPAITLHNCLGESAISTAIEPIADVRSVSLQYFNGFALEPVGIKGKNFIKQRAQLNGLAYLATASE